MALDDLLTGIPVIGGMFDDSADQARQQLALARQTWQGVQPGQIQPGVYNPQMASATTVQEDPAVKEMQMNYLSQLAGLSQNGMTPQYEAGVREALNGANSAISANNAAAMNNAAARGVAGGGLEYALREAGTQGALQNANNTALQNVGDVGRMQALYNQAYGNELGNVRGQNYNTAANNAAIMNNFNLANTGATNAANQFNVTNRQNVAQQNIGNNFDWAKGMTGADTAMAQGLYSQNAARTSARNANTAVAANFGMGAAGYLPQQQQQRSGGQGYQTQPFAYNSQYYGVM